MKAVLVIDMPITCTDGCPCYDYIHGVCANTHKDCELRKQEKPAWCPLRPLPKKMDIEQFEFIWGEEQVLFAIGYNRCVDEIEGETE